MRNCLFAQGEIDLLTAIRNGQNIEGLIKEELSKKKEKLGGKNDFQNYDPALDKNRSMILIGGW